MSSIEIELNTRYGILFPTNKEINSNVLEINNQ